MGTTTTTNLINLFQNINKVEKMCVFIDFKPNFARIICSFQDYNTNYPVKDTISVAINIQYVF